jgi:hypothetical protein
LPFWAATTTLSVVENGFDDVPEGAKNPEGARFVREVMRLVGAPRPADLVRMLGGRWLERDQQRKVYKWHSGESAPNFDGTVALLSLAGLLVEDPTPTLAKISRRDEVLERLEKVAGAVDLNYQEIRRLEEDQATRTDGAVAAVAAVQSAVEEVDEHVGELATSAAVADLRRRLDELDAFVRDALRPPRSGDGRGRRAG